MSIACAAADVQLGRGSSYVDQLQRTSQQSRVTGRPYGAASRSRADRKDKTLLWPAVGKHDVIDFRSLLLG